MRRSEAVWGESPAHDMSDSQSSDATKVLVNAVPLTFLAYRTPGREEHLVDAG